MLHVLCLASLGAAAASLPVDSADARYHAVSQWGGLGTGLGKFATIAGAVGVDAAGDVYVPDTDAARVNKYTSGGVPLMTWGWGVVDGTAALQHCDATTPCRAGLAGGEAGQFEGVAAVAPAPDGTVWTVDGPRLSQYTASGAFVKSVGWGVLDGSSQLQTCTVMTGCLAGLAGAGDGQLDSPLSLEVGADGRVYVADTGNTRVSVFSAGGSWLFSFGSAGTGAGQFAGVRDVAVDPATGDILATDRGSVSIPVNQRYSRFTSSGAFIRTVGRGVRDGGTTFQRCTAACHPGTLGSGSGELAYPHGIVVDDDGYVYVADRDNNRIEKFDSDDMPAAAISSTDPVIGPLNRPRDVAVLPDGDLIVDDSENVRIVRFDAVKPVATIGGAPSATTTDRVLDLTLSATEGATRFECLLDGAPSPCAAGYTTPALSVGQHTLQVRAIDADAIVGDYTSATFTVLAQGQGGGGGGGGGVPTPLQEPSADAPIVPGPPTPDPPLPPAKAAAKPALGVTVKPPATLLPGRRVRASLRVASSLSAVRVELRDRYGRRRLLGDAKLSSVRRDRVYVVLLRVKRRPAGRATSLSVRGRRADGRVVARVVHMTSATPSS
ncbi:MAG TPA: hypothetical protein VHB30_12280 [Solirubrobacteraceae bacterium]|nr:hypothetical protein [Solirubrobacteraceae bacterium]